MTPGPVTGGAATVGGLLLRSAQRWPEANALVEGQTMLSHGQAWARAQTVASRLADRGVRPGDRIALALPNGWRYAVAYYGVQLAGTLREWAGTQLADYKLPAELVTVSELPRNASGKVIKKQLAGLVTEIPPERASR